MTTDGKKCGYGVCFHSTGEIYEGEWKYDLRNGQGRMKYPDGRLHEGEYEDDLHFAKKLLYKFLTFVRHEYSRPLYFTNQLRYDAQIYLFDS